MAVLTAKSAGKRDSNKTWERFLPRSGKDERFEKSHANSIKHLGSSELLPEFDGHGLWQNSFPLNVLPFQITAGDTTP